MKRSTKRRVGTAYVLIGILIAFCDGFFLLTGSLIVLCGLALFYV